MYKNKNAPADMISTYCETQMQLIYNERWKKVFLMETQYFIGIAHFYTEGNLYQTRNW